mgnify:CR=1 FL=1
MEFNREVKEETVSQIVGKIYRDTIVFQASEYFIKHIYTADQFKKLVDAKTFHSIIGFLPNTKYRGMPFVMSVVYNKKADDYEITVHNPRVKY